jgi:menaquinone-dependent protoporphyrinogen oxidase
MDHHVLVAYATKHRATAELAEKIGQVLRECGMPAEVKDVRDVSDLSSYTAVVLGSAVYTGFWRKEAANFLAAHEAELIARPVWLFSSGPTGVGDPVALVEERRIPEGLKPVADRIWPREIAVLHGAIDTGKLTFFEKLLTRLVKAPVGDFRDWSAVTAWAQSIANALQVQ